jgi:hypothetical protein
MTADLPGFLLGIYHPLLRYFPHHSLFIYHMDFYSGRALELPFGQLGR